MRLIIVLLVTFGLSACTSSVAPVRYSGTASFKSDLRSVAVGQVVDQRGEEDPAWIGAVRGGYGNPLKKIYADKPVRDVVRDAFSDALQVRGLLASSETAPYVLAVTVTEFEASLLMRPDVKVKFTMTLTEAASGRQVYVDQVSGDRVGDAVFFGGVFASSDELRQAAIEAMSRAVDQALDRPGFRAAIGASGAPRVSGLTLAPHTG